MEEVGSRVFGSSGVWSKSTLVQVVVQPVQRYYSIALFFYCSVWMVLNPPFQVGSNSMDLFGWYKKPSRYTLK